MTDAWNGYHSVPIHPNDRHLITFLTARGEDTDIEQLLKESWPMETVMLGDSTRSSKTFREKPNALTTQSCGTKTYPITGGESLIFSNSLVEMVLSLMNRNFNLQKEKSNLQDLK